MQRVLHLKEQDLSQLVAIKNRSLSTDIVAFTIDGKPLNLEEYRTELEEAEKKLKEVIS